MIAARLQRCALYLPAYNYLIEYQSVAKHSNADNLSRLPLPTKMKIMLNVFIQNSLKLFMSQLKK